MLQNTIQLPRHPDAITLNQSCIAIEMVRLNARQHSWQSIKQAYSPLILLDSNSSYLYYCSKIFSPNKTPTFRLWHSVIPHLTASPYLTKACSTLETNATIHSYIE